jgi:uncharacterized tellurite resistance protein B-like protein
MRPRQFLDALKEPGAPRCAAVDEHAEMLRTLLVHLVFVDMDLDRREMDILARAFPEGDLREHIKKAASRRLNLERLAALFPDPDDREDIVTLAEHVVWGDSNVDRRERDVLDRLIEKLGVAREDARSR